MLLDLLLWAALAAPIISALGTAPFRPFDPVLLVVEPLLLGVAVAVSRRQPLVALILVVMPTLLDGNFLFAIPVMSYLTGLRMARARPAGLVFIAIAAGGTALNLGVLRSGLATWFLLATMLLFAGVFPWLLGRYRRQRGELIQAGWAQAELLEREQAGAAERVRMRERARIAQDMHDSLGHELSLIALRAGALEVAADLDQRHRAAAGELRASVAAATERLREIIGVLREDAGGRRPGRPTRASPSWSNGRVPRACRSGCAGTSQNRGCAPASGPELSAMAGRAVHRVVQEALTNAARYAPGAPVTVEVDRDAERTVVRIVNGQPPAGPLPGPVSAGTGLLGLRERVRLAGGTLSAGPRGGGFEVVARLPSVADGTVPDPDAPVRPDARPASDRMRAQRRQVRRSLLVAVTAPVAIATMLSLVYYPFVTFDSVLAQTDFDQLRIGTQRAELERVLPGRQAQGLAESTVPTAGELRLRVLHRRQLPAGPAHVPALLRRRAPGRQGPTRRLTDPIRSRCTERVDEEL